MRGHCRILLVLVLLIAGTARAAEPLRPLELRIVDDGSARAGIRVEISWHADDATTETRVSGVTDENGFVTLSVPARTVAVSVPQLSSATRVLQLPDGDSGMRWSLAPRQWREDNLQAGTRSQALITSATGTSITFTIDCWDNAFAQGQGNNCDFCTSTIQPNHVFTYACNGGTVGPWTPSCSFTSPVPAGSIVTKVTAQVNNQNCTAQSSSGTILTYGTSLNGTPLGVPITSSAQNCACSLGCHQDIFTSGDVPAGVPGYQTSGNNLFSIDISQGLICVQNVDLTVTYGQNGKKLEITNVSDPIIPSRSTLVGDCPLYRSTIDVKATNAGAAAHGIAITLSSDRNSTTATPDAITQPHTTDNAGTASGSVSTRRRGVANFKAEAADGYSPSAEYAKSFLDADFENPFLITAYGIALESDFSGATVTDPCGLSGTFNRNFLYSNRGVLMEGSGQSAGGSYISIDYNASGSPLNRNTVCFQVDSCAHTANGACAQVGTTIAVDPTVIPMNGMVNIETLGVRTAQDTGGRIRGEHIDVFAGAGRAAIDAIGSNNRRVRFIGGGAQCP